MRALILLKVPLSIVIQYAFLSNSANSFSQSASYSLCVSAEKTPSSISQSVRGGMFQPIPGQGEEEGEWGALLLLLVSMPLVMRVNKFVDGASERAPTAGVYLFDC